MHTLEPIIIAAFAQRNTLTPSNAPAEYRSAVAKIIQGLSNGSLRIAEHTVQGWVVHQWLKMAVLLYFRLHDNIIGDSGFGPYYDKVGLKYTNYTSAQFQQDKVRVVPPACVRDGAYIGPNCVLMPSYVNIGAYVGAGSMIDIWATVGSCAQIGKNVHISSNVCIGGVLEPLQANPVIIEDDCFVGTGSAIVEGVIVEQGSVIAMGVHIGQSTKIYDRERDEIIYGRVPAGALVVPGSLPSANGKCHTACAIIVKTVTTETRAKVSINELLREYI